MTSTVLDVAIMLLCVSASVVALGTTEGDLGSDGGPYTAADAADRLVTETATVTYEVVETAHETRTVHATLVELLGMAMETTGDGEAADSFRSQALGAVEDALGTRTRVDVRYDGERRAAEAGAVTAHDPEPRRIAVGAEPPRSAAVTAAVVTHPAPAVSGDDAPDRVRFVVRVW
jgi:hypothetical protein